MKLKNVINELILKRARKEGVLSDKDFADGISDLLITSQGYCIDTGSRYQVNAVLFESLAKKIKKHPLIWKMFFMF